MGTENLLTLDLFGKEKPLRVLYLGAHSDDIEIGCGGSIIKMIKQLHHVDVHWTVFSSDDIRAEEARRSTSILLKDVKLKTVDILNFKESYFPYLGASIKDYFEKLKQRISPDVIFTHYRNDAHQDHRVICELTWNTFRSNLILEYEIPKYDGDIGSPNTYMYIDKEDVERKLGHILETFKSQQEREWFNEETLRSILRIRGVECNSPTNYAEGFYCRKIVL